MVQLPDSQLFQIHQLFNEVNKLSLVFNISPTSNLKLMNFYKPGEEKKKKKCLVKLKPKDSNFAGDR